MTNFLNSLKLRKKFYLLFISAVLIPMFLTDWVIVRNIMETTNASTRNEMEKSASAVEYAIQQHLEYPVTVAHNLYKSQVMEDFLNKEYSDPGEYYEAFYRLRSSLLFDSNIGIEGGTLSIYADNPTIVNGSGFYRLDRESDWYKSFENENRQSTLHFLYEEASNTDRSKKRKVVLMLRMDMGKYNGCEKIMRMDLDYASLAEAIKGLDRVNQDRHVLVCEGSNIVLTENSTSEKNLPYEKYEKIEKGTYRQYLEVYDSDLSINVLPEKNLQWRFFKENGWKFGLMILVNLILPIIMMRLIEYSITRRIQDLEKSFNNETEDELQLIMNVEGDDEITSLTKSYNSMAIRMNELIMTVYKDKLHEQEIDIARQNAELQALHSQINPHFLFNALESIRMHSLLRGETETAEMVGKLAVMERTYVNWGEDSVSISREMEFVRAYLTLQKYRFGDRLNVDIDIDDDCERFTIPKLTLVTFVENACVHGVERKSSPAWIFIRAAKIKGYMCIEVEDTGDGMTEDELKELMERIKNVSVEDMKNKKHVGMMNAYLRLKKMTKGLVKFDISSEKGLGTIVKIEIPLEIKI